jgi:hypothetical protein
MDGNLVQACLFLKVNFICSSNLKFFCIRMANDFFHSVRRQFEYYQGLGTTTLDRLTEEELNRVYGEESNSVAAIVRHVGEDMVTRWASFIPSEKSEKSLSNSARAEVMQSWKQGWSCLYEALLSFSEADQVGGLEDPQFLRDSVQEQLAHYAYHVGQMVSIGKMVKGSAWGSFSAMRGELESDQPAPPAK